MIERRDNGDLVLHASNGDPLAKLQADGPFIAVATGPHPLDERAEKLDIEAVEAIREWCGRVVVT